jgi:DNA-binding response OmpR family regulator
MPANAAPEAKQANILLVEDDHAMVLLLKDMFEPTGHRLWCAESAVEAERRLAEVRPDLVILDLMLPDANGLVLCADLKAALGVPVIVCSGTRRRDDSLLGFKLGADDFVAKPFSVDDLKARVEMALRRASHAEAPPRPASPQPPPSIGDLVLDHALCQARLGEHVLPLTPTEYHLLCALAERPGVVVGHQELTERVWGYDDRGVRHSLEVHVQRLRAKLGVGGPQSPQVLTQRGFGYCLVPPGRSATAWPA